MDKNAIKKYAVWARRELISRVSQRAALYEISDKGLGDASADSVLGRVMSAEEKRQRQALIAQIREKGYEQVMEEISYTWFNRFIALRFMEVNGYLPSRVRVFTDDGNNFKPQILAEAINMELDGLDMEKVYALKNANDDDALFKYMIIVQCNALSSILPGMFQRISDYTELLFPDNLLREGSVIEQMVSMIPEEDWTDQVQIIGWLYQYYNTEPKDKVFADLKKNIKISKESIPAATQLFTPDWIVRYMVENSLGRLWLEGHPNDELKASWKYYLDEAEQEPDVRTQLAEIRKEYAALKPEDILAIDPCQGSGHILAYMFDVLVQIYESYGYAAREAASSIVEHNIWGLDIDDRAAQLAYFSVMMKARQYDRRFFSRGLQPHVYAVAESNNLDPHCVEFFIDGRIELKSAMDTLVKEMHDAKEYGSIITVTNVDFDLIESRFEEIRAEETPGIYSYQAVETLEPIIHVAQAMAQKYHAVITNPPYMGSANMGAKLSSYTKKHYPDSKMDMSTVFMEKTTQMCLPNGFSAMINIPVWMNNSSFAKLRNKVLKANTVSSLLHNGRGVFGSDFGTTAFTFWHRTITGYQGVYFRLFDKPGEVTTSEQKETRLLEGKSKFIVSQENFVLIPGNPFAYSLPKPFVDLFDGGKVSDYCDQKMRISTGDNDRFIRLWFEVDKNKLFYPNKWVVFSKGGNFRRWYGNRDYVINYEDNGRELKSFEGFSGGSDAYYFKPGIVWTDVSISRASFRDLPAGAIACSAGPMLYAEDADIRAYIEGFLNSVVADEYMKVLCVSVHFQWGDIAKIPLIISPEHEEAIIQLVKQSIANSKEEWDSFEASWDFQQHPFISAANSIAFNGEATTIKEAYGKWEKLSERRFYLQKENEEKINRRFIEIYGLQDYLLPDIDDNDVTMRRADLQRDVRSFISYAVGCMFGRYSLDKPGLIYAGGAWDDNNYSTYQPDKDAIIPICDDEYFEDDIVGRFVSFVETVFGKDTLEDNLCFIANALGGKGSARDVIRSYFINDFYADHCAVYSITGSGKRPIYWLFDSGKKNGFKCLIYMHRYQPDTIARIRTDYVHEQQSRYRTAIADLESRVANAGTGERVKLSKQLTKLQDQAEELRVYEEKIHHLADQMIRIDLDDGVKNNYAIFQDVLAKIK